MGYNLIGCNADGGGVLGLGLTKGGRQSSLLARGDSSHGCTVIIRVDCMEAFRASLSVLIAEEQAADCRETG